MLKRDKNDIIKRNKKGVINMNETIKQLWERKSVRE